MGTLNASQVGAFVLLDLVIILIAARLVGRLFLRLGQPRVVGEIVAGILLGPTLFGMTMWPDFAGPTWMHCVESLAAAPAGTAASPTWCIFPAQARTVLQSLGQLALLIFMFLVGLEVQFERLLGSLRVVLLVGLGVVGLPVGMGFLLSPVLSTALFRPEGASELGFVLFVGAMLAVTAFPVMVRILQEKDLMSSPMAVLGVAAAAVTTVAMFLTASIASSVASGEMPSVIIRTVALAMGYLVFMPMVVAPFVRRVAQSYRESGELDSGFFVLMFVVLFGSGLAAHLLGLTVIVGGFMAGIVMPVRERLSSDMSQRLSQLTASVLLPIFLAFSGLSTDFTRLSRDAIGGLLLLVLAGIVAKWAGGAVFGRLGGLTWVEGNALGVLMNCRGLLVLVVGLVGVQNGVITPVLQLGAVLMALITTAMTGPLFDRFAKRLPG